MKTILVFFTLLTWAAASKYKIEVRNPQGCITDFNPITEYFPDKVTPDHADHYQITYYNSFKVIKNTLHNETYIAYQCGTPKPGSHPQVPLPTGLPISAKFFSIPLSSGVAIPDTTVITFVELLGVRRNVKYVTEYFSSPCMMKAVKSGAIEIWEDTPAQNEKIEALFSWGNDDSNPKHIAAGGLTGDPGTLNRAEWIEWISAFFNREAVANAVFQGIIDRYSCHRDAVADLTRPKMYWISYSASWPTTKPPRFVISQAPYIKQFIADAGGAEPTVMKYEYAYGLDPETGDMVDELEAWFEILKEADYIVDTSYATNTFEDFISYYLLNNTADYQTAFKFIANKQVYKFDGLQGELGLDWYESSIPEPDVVLEDLIEIMHPTYQEHNRTWLRNIALGEKIIFTNESDCVDPDEAANIRANCCDGSQNCGLEAEVVVIPFQSDLNSASLTNFTLYGAFITAAILLF